jgi:phytoene dehydrogenase-like protein
MLYDGIILGSGHNSLVLQAYAGRAGLSTICLESRDVIGGGLATVEYPNGSGFLHNTHSFFHRGITHMPWYRDLELAQHGADYLQPELNVALITADGRSLEWWSDFEKTVDSFSEFSSQDGRALRRWRDEFRPIVREILVPESQSPPLEPLRRRSLINKTANGRRLLEVSKQSPLDFVLSEFEHPVVQAGLLFFNGLREVDLRLPGFGHHIPALLASDSMAQLCRGGSRQLATALTSAVLSTGGEILTNVEPRRIRVENGRACAVETDGQTYEARRFVASSLNPQQTFLDLLDPSCLPASWVSKAQAFQYNLLAPLFALNLNLSAPPEYGASESTPHLQDALMVILGLENVDRFHEIVAHHESGTVPPTVMWGSCPTRFDTSQAPAGKHTAFMWEKLPYRIGGDAANWDTIRDRHGEEMLERWTEFAPNLAEVVLDSFCRSPLDTERTLRNMRHGDLLVGAFNGGQIGYNRPFEGAGHYRGHIPGLYLCGSSCHPGGNVTGLPGYNCLQVLLADLGIRQTGLPTPLEERLLP